MCIYVHIFIEGPAGGDPEVGPTKFTVVPDLDCRQGRIHGCEEILACVQVVFICDSCV